MTLLETYFPGIDASELCSGLFSDELDKMGHRHQVSTGWKLNRANAQFFGRARTVQLETMETPDERIRKGLSFIGSIESGEILVVSGSNAFAYFGELMTRLSTRQGIGGVLIDGLTRDTCYTRDAELPIFARGYSPVDIKGRGRVADTDVPIQVDAIDLQPGDLVFADQDGTVIIPKHAMPELANRILKALEKEELAKRLIREGATIEEILDSVNEF